MPIPQGKKRKKKEGKREGNKDPFMTETAKIADYVLPAALWVEKEGSVANLDRLVKWRFKAIDPPGEAKPDYEILKELAEGFGYIPLILILKKFLKK